MPSTIQLNLTQQWKVDKNFQAVTGAFSSSTGASYIGYNGTDLGALLFNGSLRVVDSITALKNLDITYFTRSFVTAGSAFGDGGGGPYYYDATDTTSTDNGGTILTSNTGSGRWKLIFHGYLTPEIFGAAGNGTPDDRTALANADAACIANNVTLLLSRTYRVNSNITLSSPLLFAGGKIKPAAAIVATLAGQILTFTSTTGPIADTSLGGTVTITGAAPNLTGAIISGDVVLTSTTSFIRTDSADTTDNKRIIVCSADSNGSNRGGVISIQGNEFSSNPGAVIIPNGASGGVLFPIISTTASAANAFLDSANNNNLLRSTSSERYKKDIEPIEPGRANAILSLHPIWYRSKAAADNPNYSWYGLSAEDVAVVEPRLVTWSYLPEDMVPCVDERGVAGGTFKPREGAQMVPDGVQYERLSVLLLSIIQDQEVRIAKLESLMPTGVKLK